MAKCLVTGGAGFIGSHISEKLLSDGDQVRVLDNFSSGTRQNLATILKDIELVRGDIRDLETLRRAVAGVDFVFHQAAAASVPTSVRDPLGTHETNVTGTLTLLLACRDAGVRRVVFASSSAVYGDSPFLPKVEDMAIAPLSPYALQKAAGELYMNLFHALYGLETISLRYFNVFGPRQDPRSEYSAAIPKFIHQLVQGEQVTLYGDGEQSRDFVFIEDVVDANIAAMRVPASSCGKIYNIARGEAFSLNQLLDTLEAIAGRRIPRQYSEPRAGDIRHSLADICRARKGLGYTPRVGFREGLALAFGYFAAT